MEMLSNVYNPYIGANGNWYINNEDTGVKAQGSAGPQGPAGHCGIQGLIGPKGETGDRGPQGIQGPIGATGIQGLKGDVGLTGEKGDKGDTPELAIDLQSMETGKALDATMGKKLNDKISDINRKLTHENITIATNVTYDSKSYNVFKTGDKVDVSIAFSGINFTSQEAMFTFPENCRPKKVTALMGFCKRSTSTSNMAANFYINPNGQIYQSFNSDGVANKWEGVISGCFSLIK